VLGRFVSIVVVIVVLCVILVKTFFVFALGLVFLTDFFAGFFFFAMIFPSVKLKGKPRPETAYFTDQVGRRKPSN
jgi:hypothetical protein